MRPIKFRAWNKSTKNWLDMYFYFNFIEGLLEYTNEDDVIIEQYTGIKDYNNQEIYENDVVAATPMVPGDPDYIIGVVKYYNGAYWIDNNNRAVQIFSETLKLEVVGNIHSFDIAKGRKSKWWDFL